MIPAPLTDLQSRVAERVETEQTDVEYVVATAGPEGLHVVFHGNPFEENYDDLLTTLATPEVAESLVSLELRGPDEGANGTRSWDLEPLTEAESFPRLVRLDVQRTGPSDHNRSVVAAEFEEDGILAKLLALCPALEHLVSPSAPNGDFFEQGTRPLRSLAIDAGYDHQNFVRHLAESTCFPNLLHVEWGEYNETYMEDFAEHLVPPEDYWALFESPVTENLAGFVWRNPVQSVEELTELKSLRPRMQLLVVRSTAGYVGTTNE